MKTKSKDKKETLDGFKEAKIVIVVDEITSQQTNNLNEPMIKLIKDDIVEFKSDGVFVTRKIDFSINPLTKNSVKEFIKEANKIRE